MMETAEEFFADLEETSERVSLGVRSSAEGKRARKRRDASAIPQEGRTHMRGFIIGAIAGGVAVWVWRDELRKFMEKETRVVRAKAADQLEMVQKATESALDTAKEQISSHLQSGQDAIRPSNA